MSGITWDLKKDDEETYKLNYVGGYVGYYKKERGWKTYNPSHPNFLNDLTPDIAKEYGDEDFPLTLYEGVANPEFNLAAGTWKITLNVINSGNEQNVSKNIEISNLICNDATDCSQNTDCTDSSYCLHGECKEIGENSGENLRYFFTGEITDNNLYKGTQTLFDGVNESDESCCTKSSCVYNGKCYDAITDNGTIIMNRYRTAYDLNNDSRVDGFCYFHQDYYTSGKPAVWYDCDTTAPNDTFTGATVDDPGYNCREFCNLPFTKSGEEANHGEFIGLGTIGCCGDDLDEFYIESTDEEGNTASACCSEKDKCVDSNGICRENGYISDKGLVCVNNRWIEIGGRCTDSDGLNYYKRGFVIGNGSMINDTCLNSQTLSEAYCVPDTNGDLANYSAYDCPYGCENGACKAHDECLLDEDCGDAKWVYTCDSGYSYAQYIVPKCIALSKGFDCNDTIGDQNRTLCDFGCSDGHCLEANSTGCSDTDGGNNIYEKGVISGYKLATGESPVDYCLSSSDKTLVEYSCNKYEGFSDTNIPGLILVYKRAYPKIYYRK